MFAALLASEAAIGAVTGPTAIGPLLRFVRPSGRTRPMLRNRRSPPAARSTSDPAMGGGLRALPAGPTA
jgi:hypothetical protein